MKLTRVWCPGCETVVDKSADGCPNCGARPRYSFSAFGERRQRKALRGAAAASNLNAHAAHAVKHT